MAEVGLTKQPSFYERWALGGGGFQSPFSTGTGTSNTTSGSSNSNGGDGCDNNHSEKEALVQQLTERLEKITDDDDENATFTLTAEELRLLLGIKKKQPPPKEQSPAAISSSGSSAPPMVHEPPPINTIFDAWDFASDGGDLSPDEIQAIMIALAAEQNDYQQQLWSSTKTHTNNNNQRISTLRESQNESSTADLDDLDSGGPLPPPPALLSRPTAVAARQVSIQPLSADGPQKFLVTLSGKMTAHGTSDKSTITCDGTPQRPSEVVARMASTQCLPVMFVPEDYSDDKTPHSPTRQLSIKPIPLSAATSSSTSTTTTTRDSNDDDDTNTMMMPNRPSQLSVRQVSVQPLECESDTQFVVILPGNKSTSTTTTNGGSERSASSADRSPVRVARQVSIQPFPRTSITSSIQDQERIYVPMLNDQARRSASMQRQISVRVNGKDLAWDVTF